MLAIHKILIKLAVVFGIIFSIFVLVFLYLKYHRIYFGMLALYWVCIGVPAIIFALLVKYFVCEFSENEHFPNNNNNTIPMYRISEETEAYQNNLNLMRAERLRNSNSTTDADVQVTGTSQTDSANQIVGAVIVNQTINNQTEASAICVVCLTNVPSTLLNCGHANLCHTCAKIIKKTSGVCPMCQRRILTIKEDFFTRRSYLASRDPDRAKIRRYAENVVSAESISESSSETSESLERPESSESLERPESSESSIELAPKAIVVTTTT